MNTTWEECWHSKPEFRNLYRESRCGHNEVLAIIGHRLCKKYKDGKNCNPVGMQDYIFDNDNDCHFCQDGQYANLDENARQRLLWAQDARQAAKNGIGNGTIE